MRRGERKKGEGGAQVADLPKGSKVGQKGRLRTKRKKERGGEKGGMGKGGGDRLRRWEGVSSSYGKKKVRVTFK